MIAEEIDKLKEQLRVARDEIANLRLQINSANHVHRKETQHIKDVLKNFKCQNCSLSTDSSAGDMSIDDEASSAASNEVTFKPIGIIRTVFADKRAVPRQANIADNILSRVELRKDLYTNPEHAFETLENFSHLWILYHFHKNESHLKPKISPPRLDGKKVGVFAARSPHRPNPIGMSLVRLDRIEGSVIYFFGSDMVDETPVFDIKPYIPSYDSPFKVQQMSTSSPINGPRSREEPEGEEEEEEDDLKAGACAVQPNKPVIDVKIPNWINDKKLLSVVFTENATNQMQELGINQMSIQEILENDPRSVYVREKYLSQIYNFQVDENNVICKFDDKKGTVTVLQIRKLLNMNE